MKEIILKPFKIESSIVKIGEACAQEKAPIIEEENSDYLDFFGDDDYYKETTHDKDTSACTVVSKNIDSLRHFTLDASYLVPYKVAKYGGKTKSPYVILKNKNTKNQAVEIDNIYRTDRKLNTKDKQSEVIGYIEGSNEFKYVKYKETQKKKYIGVLNEEYPIMTKRPFNSKTLGYIKLDDNHDEGHYVEVIRKRHTGVLFSAIVIFTSICIIMSMINWQAIQDWRIDHTVIDQVIETIDTLIVPKRINFQHLSETTYHDGQVKINLKTEGNSELKYKAILYMDGEHKIYESNIMDANSSIEIIPVPAMANMEQGKSYTCTLVCEVYRGDIIHASDFKNNIIIHIPEPQQPQ